MGGTIHRITIAVTDAVGGDGVATATAKSATEIEGTIRAVYLEYIGTPPATTDVTIVEADKSPAVPILTATDYTTDGWLYPMAQAVNQSKTTITNQGATIVVNDYIRATIAQANADDGVNVTIVYER